MQFVTIPETLLFCSDCLTVVCCPLKYSDSSNTLTAAVRCPSNKGGHVSLMSLSTKTG